MKKNAFTLIELICVIAILGLIALIAVPTVNSAIQSARENAYDEQIAIITDTARTYMTKNSMYLPDQSGDRPACVSVNSLITSGLLSNNDIKNPKYRQNSEDPEEQFEYFDGTVVVTWNAASNKYDYTYSSESANTLCPPSI